ncbi:MAG: hypothetical protein CM15mP59_5340 [Flavobacteriaceae bacterium]|nr:MAG: hypothetical protein CM15mP59_5340 [Flavobacteriaceae bacterium]
MRFTMHFVLRPGYEYYSYDLWVCFQKQRCSVLLDAVCRYLPSPEEKMQLRDNPDTDKSFQETNSF